MKDICIHGHFYQPTRLNPWTNRLDPQPSAAPFRNWNERIAFECYAPNMAARLLDAEGKLRATSNNYGWISFDIGPTLLTWIASEHPVLLEALRLADRNSIERFGKGSAIAQPYHHPILPLCDAQDRATEIRWGLAVFEQTFERPADGIWLPETAIDLASLDSVADAGPSFVILAPHQIDSIRTAHGNWQPATEQDCANRAFRIELPSGRSIKALVYDGSTSRGVAFEGLLNDGNRFAQRMVEAAAQTGLTVVATDGESYGHHHTFGEMALSCAIAAIQQRSDARLTNTASWLAANPPTQEARILEPSSWSCAHGVGRWSRDCGCRMDSSRGWHQRWRGPLRDSLERLRDQAREALQPIGETLFTEPNKARSGYGEVLSGAQPFDSWYAEQSAPTGDPAKALQWLEVHRHLLAMFTSCAWFFDEVSGIEPLQNLRHAAAATGQLRELCGVDLSPQLEADLNQIPSNLGTELLIKTIQQNLEPSPIRSETSSFCLTDKRAGVLLPVSALDGPGPIGSLDGARDFIDWMADAGVGVWQVLPLVPTDDHGSPYSSWSTFSGNPDLVGLRGCAEAGLLDPEAELARTECVDYERTRAQKRPRVLAAARTLLSRPDHPWFAELQRFVTTAPWATDAALFHAIKERQEGAPWWLWPAQLRSFDPDAVAQASAELADEVENWRAALFIFEHQWGAVRRYAAARGIRLVGDMPIYVGRDSADVWAHQQLFQLDALGFPLKVAGVPPDAYSETGQLWGNPLFEWAAMEQDGYRWWIERVRRTLQHCDVLRIDHFIGFARYWAVDAEAEHAASGEWIPGPGRAVFDAIEAELGRLPLIAEDLGLVDESTLALRDALGLPGMKVLQFGLDGDPSNPHGIDNHVPLSVAYTGTHDSSTTRGWWEAQDAERRSELGLGEDGRTATRRMVRMALSSTSFWTILPVQDVLGLGDEARMNRPGTLGGNWVWRLPKDALDEPITKALREDIMNAGRAKRA